MSYNMNIGAYLEDKAGDDYSTNIGVFQENPVVIHQCVGTGGGTGGKGTFAAAVLRPITGTGTGTVGGNLNGGISSSLFGQCVVETSGSGFLLSVTNLVLNGSASSAGSASGALWVSRSFVLNDSDYRIQLAYDPVRLGISITRTNTQQETNDNYWYDIRTRGFYPETFQKDCRAYSLLYYPHSVRQYKGMLVGASDGYIHVFDNKSTNDRGTNVDEGIDSYMLMPPIQLGPEEDFEGKLSYMLITLGTQSLGSQAVQSDGVSYEVYVGDNIEECYKKIEDGDTPAGSGSVTGSGRSIRKRVVARGAYAVIKIYNTIDSETWTMNKMSATIHPAGRIR